MVLGVAWLAWSSCGPSAPCCRAAGRRAAAAGVGLPVGLRLVGAGVVVVRLPLLALHLVDGAGVELHQTELLQLLTGGHLLAERRAGRCCLQLVLACGGRAGGHRVGSGVLHLVVAELTTVLAVACCAWWWPRSRTC